MDLIICIYTCICNYICLRVCRLVYSFKYSVISVCIARSIFDNRRRVCNWLRARCERNNNVPPLSFSPQVRTEERRLREHFSPPPAPLSLPFPPRSRPRGVSPLARRPKVVLADRRGRSSGSRARISPPAPVVPAACTRGSQSDEFLVVVPSFLRSAALCLAPNVS